MKASRIDIKATSFLCTLNRGRNCQVERSVVENSALVFDNLLWKQQLALYQWKGAYPCGIPIERTNARSCNNSHIYIADRSSLKQCFWLQNVVDETYRNQSFLEELWPKNSGDESKNFLYLWNTCNNFG